MCAPLRSRCRKPASRAVRRSRLATARSSHVGVALHNACTDCVSYAHRLMKSAMNLSDPGRLRARLRRARARRLPRRLPRARQRRRRPRTSSRTSSSSSGASRGSSTRAAASSAPTCGSWRAAARWTLWREGQAAGRASDRLKLDVALDEGRADERPAVAAEREGEWRTLRDALRGLPAVQREAVVLAYWGGLTADQIARRSQRPARHGEEPHPPGAGARCASTSRPPCAGRARAPSL